jgi:hypothetical protein
VLKLGHRRRVRRTIKRLTVLLLFFALLSLGIYILDYLGFFRGPPNTNVREGSWGEYSYVTVYGQIAYFNEFVVQVTGLSGDTIHFSYLQTISRNASVRSSAIENYSLSLDPSHPNTFESGSALPLFVANDLENGSGLSTFIPIGSSQPVTTNYTIAISGNTVRISMQYYSGAGQVAAFIRWSLSYNETTGFLITGVITAVSNIFSYTSFNYTLLSFKE